MKKVVTTSLTNLKEVQLHLKPRKLFYNWEFNMLVKQFGFKATMRSAYKHHFLPLPSGTIVVKSTPVWEMMEHTTIVNKLILIENGKKVHYRELIENGTNRTVLVRR